MNIIKKLLIAPFACLALGSVLSGCGSVTVVIDCSRTIFTPRDRSKMSDVERYVQDYFGEKYNVDIRYRYEDRFASNQYKLGPTDEMKALNYLNLIRYTFFDVYDKVAPAGFTEKHTIKLLVLFGTRGFGPTQNLLGEAPFGMIQVYDINRLNIPYFDADDYEASTFNYYYQRARDNYIQTLYHESAHTLHQDTPVPEAFLKLTISDYQQDNAFSYWYVRGISSLTAGFISDYASKSPEEDFAELFGNYVILSADEWEAKLVSADVIPAGRTRSGRSIIEEKITIIKDYMLNTWGLDMDKLRAQLHARYPNFARQDFTTMTSSTTQQ